MKTINVDLSTGEALNLLIGRQGENNVTQVIFDFSALKTEFGTGTLSLSVKRPKEYVPYAQTMTVSGTNATWLVNETDTGNFGCGEIQLTYTVSGKVAKTVIYKYTVYRSIGVDGEYPIPGQTWQEEIEEDIAEIKEDLSDLQAEIEGGGSGLTADLKDALDQLAQKVAYIVDDGQDYYDALHNALYPSASLSYITCVYTQSGTVYDTYTLDSLKSDLVVTAHMSDSTSHVVTTYTLSGTLEGGTSTITVSYDGKTTTFNVTVSSRLPSAYRQVEYIQSNGTQYIITDIAPRDTRTLVTFEFVDFIANKDNYITGVYNDSNQRYYAAWVTSTGAFEVHNRSNNIKWTGPTNPTGKHSVDFNNASHQMLYDGEVKATDSTFAITSGDNKLAIFTRGVALPNANIGNFVSIAKIYSLKYEDNTTGNAVGEFIPCYRKSDNVVGMYDLVSEQFYVDYASGDPFVKGSTQWETP